MIIDPHQVNGHLQECIVNSEGGRVLVGFQGTDEHLAGRSIVIDIDRQMEFLKIGMLGELVGQAFGVIGGRRQRAFQQVEFALEPRVLLIEGGPAGELGDLQAERPGQFAMLCGVWLIRSISSSLECGDRGNLGRHVGIGGPDRGSSGHFSRRTPWQVLQGVRPDLLDLVQQHPIASFSVFSFPTRTAASSYVRNRSRDLDIALEPRRGRPLGGTPPDVALPREFLGAEDVGGQAILVVQFLGQGEGHPVSESGPRNVLARTMNGPACLVRSHGSMGSLGSGTALSSSAGVGSGNDEALG